MCLCSSPKEKTGSACTGGAGVSGRDVVVVLGAPGNSVGGGGCLANLRPEKRALFWVRSFYSFLNLNKEIQNTTPIPSPFSGHVFVNQRGAGRPDRVLEGGCYVAVGEPSPSHSYTVRPF